MKTQSSGRTGPQQIVTNQFPVSSNTEAPTATKPQKVEEQNTDVTMKALQQNAAARRSESILESRLRQTQIQSPGVQWTGPLKLSDVPVTPPISEFGEQIRSLLENLQSLSMQDPVIDCGNLEEILSSLQELSVPPEMDTNSALNILGASDEVQKMLFEALSDAGVPTEIISLISAMLAGLQGRAGSTPLGFPPGSSNEKQESQAAKSGSTGEAGRQERAAKAKEIANSGALG